MFRYSELHDSDISVPYSDVRNFRILFMSPLKRLLQFVSTAIRLRFGFDSTTTKNEHVHFFRRVERRRSQSEGSGRGIVIVYVTVIRMTFHAEGSTSGSILRLSSLV